MPKTCNNCYWNDGQNCRNEQGSYESDRPGTVCSGWKPIKKRKKYHEK